MSNKERLAIIDYYAAKLIIVDVSEEELSEYDDSEEEWIKANIDFKFGDFSWTAISRAEYYPDINSEGYDIEFKDYVD